MGTTVALTVQGNNNERRVDEAIKKLSSGDENVRQIGRQEILRLGALAGERLVKLLSELVRDQHPRFVVEKEDEGRRAVQDLKYQVEKNLTDADGSDAMQTIKRLAINGRLIPDLISLLGEIRAVEAIPILIRIMERKNTWTVGSLGIEIEALIRIGSPAIPRLIECAQNAKERATAACFQRSIIFGYRISFDPDDDIATDEDEDSVTYQDTLDSDDQWEVDRRALKIKENVIQILGEIGDRSALPFLEVLAGTQSRESPPVVSSALHAVSKIKKQPIPSNKPAVRKQ